MISQDLLLKTAFCCMACDGDIAPDEIDVLRDFVEKDEAFKGYDVQSEVNKCIVDINDQGVSYLAGYLKEVADADLDDESAIKLVTIAIRMIEADNKIEYSEVRFFKRIRNELKISDDKLYEVFPDKEDYFLPDIMAPRDIDWSSSFEAITL